MQIAGRLVQGRTRIAEEAAPKLSPWEADYETDASNPLDRFEATKGGAEGQSPD